MKILAAAAASELLGIMPDRAITEQGKAFAKTLASLADRADRVVLSCGGTTQVAEIERVLELGKKDGITPGAPFDAIVGMSEGFIQFNVEQLITNALIEAGRSDMLPLTAILTQTEDGPDGGLPVVLEAKAIHALIHGITRYLLAGCSGGIPVQQTEDGWAGADTLHSVYLTAAAVGVAAGADTLLLIVPDTAGVPSGTFTPKEARDAAGGASLSDTWLAASLFAGSAPDRTAIVCRASEVSSAFDGHAGAAVCSS